MCGIIGIVSRGAHVAPALLEALKKLEYRGYDSAGLATRLQIEDQGPDHVGSGEILCCKAAGKVANLIRKVKSLKARVGVTGDCRVSCRLPGRTGVGHTRWATHGAPTCVNAHPHLAEGLAVVHNGIVENYSDVKAFLEQRGITCSTQTDTEVVARLVSFYIRCEGLGHLESVRRAAEKLKGRFSLAFLFEDQDCLVGLHMGNPLAVGHGPEATALASDILAMGHLASKFTFLEPGDIVCLTPGAVEFHRNTDAGPCTRRTVHLTLGTRIDSDKGLCSHYMLKEIREQPKVLDQCFRYYTNRISSGRFSLKPDIWLQKLAALGPLETYERIIIVACGTSFYAALIARFWLRSLMGDVWIDVEVASEFRIKSGYGRRSSTSEREPSQSAALAVFVSQSGETADTLSAMCLAQSNGMKALAIVNSETSSMARQADAVLPICAGFEIGVASTKTFSAQLLVLAFLALHLDSPRKSMSDDLQNTILQSLFLVPQLVTHTLLKEAEIKSIALAVAHAHCVVYLGRGVGYPLALEGALKLKEVTYIQASAYPSGELKHGPIALVEEGTPVVVIAPFDDHFDKLLSNVQEVASRGAKVVFVSSQEGIERAGRSNPWIFFETGECTPFCSPFSVLAFLQLLAYYTAVIRGTDVDQPRNLAKSVTVE